MHRGQRIEAFPFRGFAWYYLGMDFTVKITGTDELDKVLAKLPRATQRKAIMPALRAGAAEIRDMAAVNVKSVATMGYATGLLARSLRVYNLRKYRGNYRVAVQVKRNLLTKDGTRVALYAAVLEYGKKNQPPQSWIRKAAREGKDIAFRTVTKEIGMKIAVSVLDAKR